MRYLLPIAIALLAACEPTPVWMPGDQPLTIWAETDQAWAALEAGCVAWSWSTGLACRRVDARADAGLVVVVGGADGTADATTRYRYGLDGWEWETSFKPEVFADVGLAARTGAHELGHALGIVDHLPEGNVMGPFPAVIYPTVADLEALADAWGEAPWIE